MGHFGFSYMGLIFMLLLTVPNLMWTKAKPLGYSNKKENKILSGLERVGEVLVTCCALFFTDYNLKKWSMWTLWLIAAIILMLMYEYWWVRYFNSEKTLEDFYSSLGGIPVAGAVLPVLAFLLLGIYGRVAWMLGSVIILGIGHIGIHIEHRRELPLTETGGN